MFSRNIKSIKRHDGRIETKPKLYCPFSSNMRVTSGYRTVRRPNHKGVDIVPTGIGKNNIYSCGWMKCIRTLWDKRGGNVVVLTSLFYPEQLTLKFMHLSKVHVKTGDILKARDLIGVMGNTGHSKGAHLHLEVWYPSKDGWSGKTVNPIKNVDWIY